MLWTRLKYYYLVSWCVSGEFSAAADHFEDFYTLTSSKDWMTKEKQLLHSEACEHLRRLYTATAESFQSEYNTDNKEAINYLLKAYEMAKESKKCFKGESSLIKYYFCYHKARKELKPKVCEKLSYVLMSQRSFFLCETSWHLGDVTLMSLVSLANCVHLKS